MSICLQFLLQKQNFVFIFYLFWNNITFSLFWKTKMSKQFHKKDRAIRLPTQKTHLGRYTFQKINQDILSQLLWKSNSLNGGCLQVGFPMKSFSIVPSTHTWCVMISDQCYCCSIPSSPQFILFRVECQLRTIRRAKWIAQFQTSWCCCGLTTNLN